MSLDFKLTAIRPTTVFNGNISNNLIAMAEAAGVYNVLWRPSEYGYHNAGQIAAVLSEGLELLASNPEHFKKFDSQNGWGQYDDLVAFINQVLVTCDEFPDADISVAS